VTRTLALVAALALVLAACGGGGDDDEAGAKNAPSTTKPAATKTAPLTGLPDPDGAAQTRPVLNVKIENTPQARPQSGLEVADVVWDEVVEGEITRLLAMFQSRSTDVVGPIRSVRLTDPSIVWPVGGIFAYSGGAPAIVHAIEQAPVKLVDERSAGAAMFRDPDRRAPHNLFGKPDALWGFGGTPAPPPPLFRYLKPGKQPVGEPTTGAAIAFKGDYQVDYQWDAASGTWLRSTAGAPFVARSGTRVAPKNVVILPVTYQGGVNGGGVGKEGSEAVLVGSGSAIVLTGGVSIRASWTRPAKEQPMQLQTADGKPLKLTPGSTWVELPDVSYAVDLRTPAPAPTG
jgi:hypothetical protein